MRENYTRKMSISELSGFCKSFFAFLIIFHSALSLRAQNSLNSGDFVGGTWGSGQAMSASAGGSLIITKTVASLGDKYFRFYGDGSPCGEYQPTTNGDFFTHNVAVTAPNGNCGNANAWRINVPTATSTVVFKTDGGNDGMDRAIAYVIQGAVQSVNTVTQAPVAASVFPGQAVTITANLSAAFATGQAAYIRYSTDNFVTSSVVAMTTGTTTARTGIIPATANTPGAVVRYYVFTSGNTAPAANGSDADFSTINLNNNAGSNYSYTVATGWTTAAAGNWNANATWTAGVAPSTTLNIGTVTINHAVTQNVAAVASSIVISAAGTLTGTANTLTINNNTSGTNFSNSGTMALSATHAVAFAGTGTHSVSGTCTFNNVSTATGVNFGSSSTVNGNFTINSGGFVQTNAPTYGASSFLIYSTGAGYAASTEWTQNALTGQGVPQNVSLATAGTSVNFGSSGQYRRLRGNLSIVASTTLALSTASGGDLRIGGNWTNAGTFTPNSRAVIFDGTAGQAINSASTFAFLIISNTSAAVTTTVANIITGGLTIDANARLSTTAALTYTGSTSTVNGFLRSTSTFTGTAANLTFSSTGTYEHNATNGGSVPLATWQAGSTCSFIGLTTGTTVPTNINQAFSNVVYNCPLQSATMNFAGSMNNIAGNFSILSTGNKGLLRIAASTALNLNIGGNMTVSDTIDVVSGTGATTINIGGNFSQTAGLIQKSGTGTLAFTFNKSSGTQTITQSGGTITAAANWNAGNGTSTNTVQLASNLNLGTGTGTFAVANNATLDLQGFVISGSGGFTPATGSTLISANANGINTSGASGSVQTTTRTFTNAGVNYSFNGASAQVTGTAVGAASNIKNLTINNSSGLTLSASATLSSTGVLTFTSGLLDLSTFNLTLTSGAAFSGQGTGKYVKTSSTGRLVQTVGSSAVLFPLGNSAYNPITLTNTGTSDTYSVLVLDATTSPAPNNSLKIVNRYWSVTEGVAGGGSLAVTAQYNAGEPNADFATGTTLNMGIHNGTDWAVVLATSSGAGPFSVSNNSNFYPSVASYTFGIAKDEGLAIPAYDFTWTGASSSDWGTAGNWDLGSVPAVTDNIIIPTSASYTNALNITGTRTCAAITVSGDGTFSMAASSTLTVNGNWTYSSSVAPTFNCSSSLNIAAPSPQTIAAFNYGSLNINGGPRTLASSGTIGICGTYSSGAGVTITGSSINFNGSGAQTIAVGSYNNLSISNNRGGAAITLPSGTISVAAAFDVSSLSNYTASVNAASVFDFTSASSQNIPAFFYGQLNNTGNGPRVWASSGIIDVNQGFSPGSGTQTITGSTMQFSGSGTYSLTTFTTNVASRQFNNLNITGAGGTWQMPGQTLGITGNLSISNGTFRLANGVTTTNNATFTVDGNLSISGGSLDLAAGTTAIGTLNLSGDFSQTGGTIFRSATTSTTSSFNLIKTSGIQTITQIGGALTLTGFTMNAGNGTSTNTVRLVTNLSIGGTPGTSPAGFLRIQALASFDFQTYNISGTGGFTTAAGSTLITANTDPAGAFNAHPATTGSLQNGAAVAQRVFATTANYVYNGASDQFIGNGLTTVNNLTINTSGGAKVTLNLATGTTALNVNNILTLTSGVLYLNSGVLYAYNDVQGAPFGTSNMIVTNQGSVFPQRNPGQFRRYFPTAAIGATQTVTTTFPMGDITGTAEYTPMSINLSYTAGAAAVSTPYFGVKCIDARNPYDASLDNYITRYWIITTGTAFNNATTVALDMNYEYKTSDVVGNEAAIKMNRFSTATLQNVEDIASYTDVVDHKLYSITMDKTMFTDHDFFGRKTVPLYYRSNASGKWQDVNNWLISSDVNFTSPAGIVPPIPPNSANSDSIAILAAHTIAADTTFPPYYMDQTLVQGTLQVASGATMIIANGPGSLDAQVNGNFTVAGTQAQATGSTLKFGNGGIYEHATPTANAKIPTATWSSGSECRITGITGSLLDVATLNQAFSDFTWNCSGQTASLNLSGNLSNVGRDLKIVNTGGLNLGLVAGTGSLSMNVGRNLEVSGGNIVLTTGSISPIVDIAGDIVVSSGTLDFNSGTGSTATLNLSGNFSQTGGVVRKTSGTNAFNFVKTSGIQTISQTGGTITGVVNINFGNGTTTSNTVQLASGLVNGTGTITSRSGATTDFQTFAITGSGTFTAATGTNVNTANPDGINTSGATGSVQTSTRIFTQTGVNYVYNGSSAQAAGTALGAAASINNLEINNAAGLTISAPLTINGTTAFTNGRIDLAGFDVTLGATAAFSNQGSGRYFRTSGAGKLKQTVAAAAKDFPVGNSAYNPIQLTNSGTSDVFGVQVSDVVSSPAANDPTKIINRYWLISENTSGGSNLSITAQYNAGEEATNFNSSSNPVMGLYTSTSPLWKYQSASSSGSGPVAYTASFSAFTGTSYTIGIGKDDAFNCLTPPAISSFSPSSAYAGETITLTGTGLSGLTSATIGGTSAVIASQSGTSATITVQEGSTGTIFLTTSPGCGDFSASTLTFLGYKSAQTGNWGTASTWLGNFIPVSGNPVLIASGHNVTSNVASTPSTLTIEAGGTLTLSNSAKLGNASLAATINGTLVCPATVTSPSSGLQASALTIANGGTFTNSATAADAIGITTFNVNAGGTYNHDALGTGTAGSVADFPGLTGGSNITINSNATINITRWGIDAQSPPGLPTVAGGQWGNLTINLASQTYSGSIQNSGAVANATSLNILATGTRDFRLTTPASSYTGTFGSLNVSGGIFALCSGGSTGAGNVVLNVNGNTSLSGGAFSVHGSLANSSACTGTVSANFNGNVSISGGTLYGIASSSSTGTFASGTTTINISGDLGMTGGTLDFASIPAYVSPALATGSVTLNLSGNLDIQSGATVSSSNSTNTGRATASNFNFSKASGTQTFSDAGTISNHAIVWTVNGGANTLSMSTSADFGTSASSSFSVNSGSTLDCGANVLSGGGVFTAQSGSTLRLGSAAGISSAPTASGNIQFGTRTFNGGAGYVYNGSADQSTGTGLPSTITGNLTIANTGSSGNNTVTLTTTNTTVSTFNLSSGLFAAGSGQNLNLANAGVVNATGGDFASGATAGTVTATGSAVFNGTSNPYNVYAAGGVNFGAQTVTIQNGGTFRINSGGFVSTNAPFYAAGSTLEYNTGGPYDRGLEWNSVSGRGAPHHVTVTSTTLNPAKTGGAYAATDFNTLGDLTIASGGNIYMDFGSNNMTAPLNIAGNLNLTGNLSGSNSAGGDINVGGNWTNNGSGTNFFSNNRQVTFNGSAAQTIGGSIATMPAFDYLAISNTSGDVTTIKSLTVNQRVQMNSGKLILGNNNLTLGSAAFFQNGGASSYVVTNGTGTVTQNVSGGDDWYPVGPSTGIFGPVTLNQSGTADNISVRVSTAPAFTNAVNDNSKMVNLEWTMSEGTGGGNNISTTFGWTDTSEAASFDRSAGVFHGHYTGSNYSVRAANATTGTDPYYSLSTTSQPYTGNLSSQRFVIGNISGILPCLQTSAAGNWNNASNWLSGIVPPAGTNVCLRHAMSVTTTLDNPSGVTFETGGSLNISNGTTLTLASPGTITNSSGALVDMTSGSIAFSGLGIVNGGNAIGFNNLELNGNTTLTTTPTINGTLEIKPGGFLLNATGPNYGASSTLKYNTGGSYNRSNEWSASSGSGFPASVQVSGNTSLDISTGAAGIRQISGNMTVDAGSSLTQGSLNQGFIVPGNFTLNGSYTMSSAVGGDLVVSGNWSSGSSASLTHNNRDIRFDGAGTQTISVANGLGFGFLTIDNSGAGVDLLSTITVNTFRVNAGRSFSLEADKIIISAGGNLLINGTFDANDGTIEYTNGGNFTNNGTFNRGTSTLDFVGSSAGVVTGTVQTNFHNIRLFPGGGIDFGSGALRGRVSGTLQLRAGSYVANNSPIYEAGSKLMYSGGGTFNRNVEWDPSTVQKVEVTNNTTLKCGVNGTSFNHSMADSLIIRSGSTLDMSSPNMTAPMIVGGHVQNDGTITLSGSIGGDLEVSGDFVNNGTFNANDRATTFKGSIDAGIKGTSNTIFHYLTVDKSAGKTLTVTVPFSIGTLSTGSQVRVAGGTFDLNNQAVTFLSGNHTLRIDNGFAKSQTLKTGGSDITGFSSFSSNGSNSDTLGGKLNYSGAGSETLIAPVKGYNQLWITGGSSKNINQNVLVNDSLMITPGSSLDFGSATSTLEVRGHLVNNGNITGSSTGKVFMSNTAARSLTGTGSIRNLDILNASGVSVSGKPIITNSLNFVGGKVYTGADTILLGSAAAISEVYTTNSYVVGNLKTVRTINTLASNFGGMGVDLTAGDNLGTVTVIRSSGAQALITGLPLSPDSSINWNWTITPSQQPAPESPNRSLTLSWPVAEDNGKNPSAMQIWKRSTELDPWEEAGIVQVAGGNAVMRSVVWNNVNGFSQFTVGENNVPLALELLSLAARREKNHARIDWKVSEDGKARYYQLEKSVDNGRNYSAIEKREAGAKDGVYAAFDYSFFSDSYYRIRVIREDGSEDVSKSVFLKNNGSSASWFVFPNPSSQGKGIQIKADFADVSVHQAEVYNSEGRQLMKFSGTVSELNTILQSQSSSLAQGVYMIRIRTESGHEALRFIIE